jgi:hypothetical protein
MIDISHLSGRVERLRSVQRYGDRKVMFYRTDLEIHTTRLLGMFKSARPVIKKTFPDMSLEELELLIAVHDDHETYEDFEDVTSYKKVGMSDTEKQAHENREAKAIIGYTNGQPYFLGENKYPYRDFLMRWEKKECAMSQCGSYLDKIDAVCEIIHEVFAGNPYFMSRVIYGVSFNQSFLQRDTRFPLIKKLFEIGADHPFFSKPKRIERDFDYIPYMFKPHTRESILIHTGYEVYDLWKEVTLVVFGLEKGMQVLTKQKEFL